MFTGIIESIGKIARWKNNGGDVRLHIATGKLDLSDVALGDSIAVNGVCLTAVVLPGDGLWLMCRMKPCRYKKPWSVKYRHDPVNLEKALTMSTRFRCKPSCFDPAIG